MRWPQITIIGLVGAEIGFSLALHGQPRAGNHSFFSSLFAWGIIAGVMWAGGFWDDRT